MSEIEKAPPQSIVVRPSDPAPVAYTDADFTITDETARRLRTARPENTRRAYKWHWDKFTAWCTVQGRTPLPATPHTLTDFIVRLMSEPFEFSPATIDQAIGTIRSEHRRNGYKGQPDTERTLEIFADYKREWAEKGNRARKAPPILIDDLRAMVDTCDPDMLSGIRDRALLLLGFNVMARRSEIAALDIGDVRESSEGLTVYIRSSKTDQSAQGVEVHAPYGQHAETCVVRAFQAWRAALAERGITGGALFRPIDRHGRLGDEHGAAGRARTRITGKSVSDIVRRRAEQAGLPNDYTGHSLRSGAATSAYAAGNPVSAIAEQGRWSPKSPVVLGYIRSVDKWKNNPMKGIGL